MFRLFLRLHLAFSLLMVVLVVSLCFNMLISNTGDKITPSESGGLLHTMQNYGDETENTPFSDKLGNSPQSKRQNEATEKHHKNAGNPLEDITKSPAAGQRKSLLIFGHDRSGTTFLSRMFNADSQIFNVYEPLWITAYSFNPPADTRGTLDVLGGLLDCKFSRTPSGVQFLSNISSWFSIRVNSAAMMSNHFCSVTSKDAMEVFNSCSDMSQTPKRTDEICLKKYRYSVTKIATSRTPNKRLSSLIPKLFDENPETDIKVLHVVRDPRGNIHSRMKLKWFKDFPHPEFDPNVKAICEEIVENMKFVQKQIEMDERNNQEKRFMTVSYKEIAGQPLETAKKIYSFAEFEMAENLSEWITKNTKPSQEILKKELERPYSHVRNATGNADRWRMGSPKGRIRAIENVCQPLMRMLGLDKIQ